LQRIWDCRLTSIAPFNLVLVVRAQFPQGRVCTFDPAAAGSNVQTRPCPIGAQSRDLTALRTRGSEYAKIALSSF